MIPKVRNRLDVYAVFVCASLGVRYRGIQSAVPSCGLEAHVLWDDHSGSTLALPVSQFNPENVKQHTEESNAKWRKR